MKDVFCACMLAFIQIADQCIDFVHASMTLISSRCNNLVQANEGMSYELQSQSSGDDANVETVLTSPHSLTKLAKDMEFTFTFPSPATSLSLLPLPDVVECPTKCTNMPLLGVIVPGRSVSPLVESVSREQWPDQGSSSGGPCCERQWPGTDKLYYSNKDVILLPKRDCGREASTPHTRG
jgi:hypothetical protein